MGIMGPATTKGGKSLELPEKDRALAIRRILEGSDGAQPSTRLTSTLGRDDQMARERKFTLVLRNVGVETWRWAPATS